VDKVRVEFSEDIDPATGIDINNFTITGLTISGASFNTNPKVVRLTTDIQLHIQYNIEISAIIKDLNGNQIASTYSGNFQGAVEEPRLENTMGVKVDQVLVEFSEDVDSTAGETASYAIYPGITISAVTFPYNGDSSFALLQLGGNPNLDDTLTISVPNSITGLDLITITAKDTENLSLNEFNRTASTNELIAYSITSAINADPQSPARAYVNGSQVELVSRTFGSNGDMTITGTLANVTLSLEPLPVNNTYESTTVNADAAVRSDGNYAQVDLDFTSSTLTSGIYELKVENVADTAVPANIIGSASTSVVLRGSDSTPPQLAGVFAPDSTHIKLLFDEPVDFVTAIDASNFCIEREIASFSLTSGTSSGDTLTLTYDGGPTYILTAGSGNDPSTNTFDAANKATSTENIAMVLNVDTDSPVWAHFSGSTIYLARRTPGSGTIDSVVSSPPFTSGFSTTPAKYTNNRTIVSSARNDTFPSEVILTLDSATPLTALASSPYYGITATGIADITIDKNTGYGGTRIVLPLSTDNTSPAADSDPPELISAEAISDGLVQIIFSEAVDELSAESTANYTISPALGITSAVWNNTNKNTVLLYTEHQGALTYTLTVNGVLDQFGNAASYASIDFSGMAAVTVDNGPVGNSINGIGNVNNLAITAMASFNNRLYIATKNSGSGTFVTEVYASDSTGVYFTQANYSGFAPPTAYHKQRQTTSFAVYNDGSGSRLWASTSDTPSEKSNVFYTPGTTLPVHDWTQDTYTTDWNNTTTRLLNYGISASHLYVIEGSNLDYRSGDDSYTSVSGSWGTGTPTEMTAFGGRMYVGVGSGTGMMVFRSKGVNADFPQGSGDFEQVLDADLSGILGMDGYDTDDPSIDNHYPNSSNTSVTSMAVFKGYIYVGTENSYGAQVWRSQDGLTWSRVLDFGDGIEFGGINESSNDRITSLQNNGNYLYAGTRNTATGAEVWRTPDGITWEQFGSDGFGSSSYSDVSSMHPFLGLIYIGMEDLTAGGAIFRASN